MLERDARARVWGLSTSLALLLLADAKVTAGQTNSSPEGELRVSVLGRPDRSMVAAVNQAVRGALEKLANPECQKVFSDFKDAAGRVLSKNLDEKSETPSGYLQWLIFRNGSDDAFCVRGQGVLGTNPGDRFIHLCGRFTKIQLTDPGYAAALVIHEELHALGLGENPPTSDAITKAVVDRCGR